MKNVFRYGLSGLALLFLSCLALFITMANPARALDLEKIAFEVIDLLPLKPEEKGFAKFTVKSPDCSAKLVESIMGDKIMAGMTAVFKAYKPGIKPFDIHSVAECKMKMNPVNFAFSKAMGESKGLISEMPEPFDDALQSQADQTAGEFQEEANASMMEAFPFTKHIECACEAAFHEFSPSIENTFAAIKSGNAKQMGEAVYTLAIENSSLPIKPVRLIIEGDIKGAATSLVGQYGIPVGCKVAEIMLGVPSQICEAAAGVVGKGAKFVAGIGEDIYDELAGTAADPNQYYADHWRPWLSFAAANRIGEDGGWIQKGETAAQILPAIWKPCVKYYADHGNLLEEVSFTDDDAAREICDPMRDQFAGAPPTSDLNVVVATARKAAKDFYETGFKDALYKQALPAAGNPAKIVSPSPKLFAACIKGVDPLVSTLPARNEADREALSDALCNELLLGPNNTVLKDLKAIAASIAPVKSEIQIKKEIKESEEKKKAADSADLASLEQVVFDAKGKCNPLAGSECPAMRTHLWNGCAALLNRTEPLPLSKAKSCITGFVPATIQPFNDLEPQLAALRDRCNALLPDEGNRKACLTKSRAALYACGKPSIAGEVAAFKALADDTPDISGNKLFEQFYNHAADLMAAQAWLGANACPAVEAYFTALQAKYSSQPETPDTGTDDTVSDTIAKARRDLVRLGCAETARGSGQFKCAERTANSRCNAYRKRGLIGECLLEDGSQKQTSQPEAPSGGGSENNPADDAPSPGRVLAGLGCEEVEPGSNQFRCFDRAANSRCIALMKRKQVARCILRTANQNQAEQPAPPPDEEQQVQSQRPSPQRDLIGIGCTDLRDDGNMYECPNVRAYRRCESYKGKGQVTDCFLTAQ